MSFNAPNRFGARLLASALLLGGLAHACFAFQTVSDPKKKKTAAKTGASNKTQKPKPATHHAMVSGKTKAHGPVRPVMVARAGPPVFHEVEPATHGSSEVASLGPPPAAPFLYPHALDGFFRALAAHQVEASSGVVNPNAESTIPALASTVRVLQFGDSHTAADLFTGALRFDLQAEFGDGGLGFQYPGHPFAGYRLGGSNRAQSAGWVTEGNRFTQLGSGDLGLGGISIETTRADEWVTLSTTCTTLQVQYLRQAGGGRLSFLDNGVHVSEIDTSLEAGAGAAGTLTYACTAGMHDFALETLEHAPVKLFGLVTEQPGVTYECLGINGAVATLMLRWNQTIFAEYLRQRNPALIVLAYGTNEAAGSAAHNDEYIAEFNRLLETLHRIVPAASVLVLGPYDRATKVGRGKRSAWQTWGGTDRILADQKAACRVHGCAFYDERERMGGPGSMIRWAAAGLAQGDHTHLSGTGYRTLADALYDDLMVAYRNFEHTAGRVQLDPLASYVRASTKKRTSAARAAVPTSLYGTAEVVPLTKR